MGVALTQFKFDDGDYRKLLESIADTLSTADQHFRATHGGLPIDVVRTDAPDALPSGITLSDSEIESYAQAAAAGEPFEFRLLG
jgi:hypothetical protein